MGAAPVASQAHLGACLSEGAPVHDACFVGGVHIVLGGCP